MIQPRLYLANSYVQTIRLVVEHLTVENLEVGVATIAIVTPYGPHPKKARIIPTLPALIGDGYVTISRPDRQSEIDLFLLMFSTKTPSFEVFC